MFARPPHDQTPPEPHPAEPDVLEARLPPRLHRPRQGIGPVMLGDVGAKEPTYSEPLAAPRVPAPQRKGDTGVEPPPESPEVIRRQEKLQAGDRSARFHHSCQLAERGLGIV